MNAPLMIETTYTAEEMYDLDKEHRYELVDGVPLERTMSVGSSLVATRLVVRVGAFADSHGLGYAFATDLGYKLFPDNPRSLRYPDVSFVRRDFFPDGRIPKSGYCTFVPALAVEVVSPTDEAEVVEARVSDFLRAGVELVWVVYPEARSAYVIRADGSAARLTESGELSGENVLPGFIYRVGDLFQGL